MITRHIKPSRTKHFFLFGARQTGKTTLVSHTFLAHETHTINLLLSKEFLRYQAHPEIFQEEMERLPKSVRHVFIDEVQRQPLLLNEVQNCIDRKLPVQFILSGSSARKLRRLHANLLGGRAWVYHLYPLTIQELGEKFDLNRALQWGTLPSHYLEQDPSDIIQGLRAYTETYLQEEVQQEALVRNLGTFIRFLDLAAFENGKILDYSSIARECNSTHTTVKEYFKILEDTLLATFLFPYIKSRRKRLTKHPKFYFFDTGVLRSLQKKLSVRLEPHTPEYGEYFEAFIVNEVFRMNSYLSKDWSVYFFRTASGAEVDLVIETPRGQFLGIEIKSSENPHASTYASGFQALDEIRKLSRRIVICRAPHPRRTEDGVEILPWKIFFQEFGEL